MSNTSPTIPQIKAHADDGTGQIDAQEVRRIISKLEQRAGDLAYPHPTEASKAYSDAAEALASLLPARTMHDMAWDDQAHHLTVATDRETGTDVIMLAPHNPDVAIPAHIHCAHPDGSTSLINSGDLVPTKRKRRLTDGHAERRKLVTEDDYRSAPAGTVATHSDLRLIEKHSLNVWGVHDQSTGQINWLTTKELARDQRTVLRWGTEIE